MKPELEETRQAIRQAEDMIEEQPLGRIKFDNECRLDRCREVLKSAEDNSYLGYAIKTEIDLIHHLISLIYKNLR